MILIPLLLSATLDMSLPEFTPEPDASGNYIVSSVVDDEVVVEELTSEEFEELPIIESVSDNSIDDDMSSVDAQDLSASPVRQETLITRAIEVHNIDASTLSNYRVSGGALQAYSGDILYYIYLTAGIEYTITSGQNLYTCKGLWKNAVCTSYTDTTITPSENLYLVRNNASLSVSYTTGEPNPKPEDPSGNDPEPEDPSGNDPEPEDPSGNDPENPSGGGSYDDAILITKIDRLINICRALCLILIFDFGYPVVLSIVKNIVGGEDNV